VKRTALAVILLLAAPDGRGDGPVRAEVDLHLRFTSLENRPGTEVRYDPERRTFALEGYLVPDGREHYGSGFATVRAQATALDGDLVFRLQADTGEVRGRRFAEPADVCLTPFAPAGTGLSPPDSPACALYGRAVVPLDTVADGPSRLTLNGRPAADELRATWLVRELSANLALGRAGFTHLSAGRRRVIVGDGLIHDDYGAVAEASFDVGAIGPPFEATVAVLVPSREWPTSGDEASPMITLRAAWLPSLFESAGLFGAVMRDRTGSVAESLKGQYVERQVVRLAQAQTEPGTNPRERVWTSQLAASLLTSPRSEATLVWLGSSGVLAPWRGHRLAWTAAVLEGRIASIDAGELRLVKDVSLHGRAGRASWDVDLPWGFSAGASFLYLSGGTLPVVDEAGEPGTGTYQGFLGVSPFIPYTGLFFGGGLSATFAARQATAPGVNGRGVLAPAARLSFDPSETVSLDTKVAWLRADVVGPHGGKIYGWEADLTGSVSPAPWLTFALELDALWPGDFYGGRDTVYKAVLAVDVVTP
jgi:hypothetical protein